MRWILKCLCMSQFISHFQTHLHNVVPNWLHDQCRRNTHEKRTHKKQKNKIRKWLRISRLKNNEKYIAKLIQFINVRAFKILIENLVEKLALTLLIRHFDSESKCFIFWVLLLAHFPLIWLFRYWLVGGNAGEAAQNLSSNTNEANATLD